MVNNETMWIYGLLPRHLLIFNFQSSIKLLSIIYVPNKAKSNGQLPTIPVHGPKLPYREVKILKKV